MRRTTEDESKLPQWAQQKIATLRQNYKLASERLLEIANGKGTLAISGEGGNIYQANRRLPVDSVYVMNGDSPVLSLLVRVENGKRVIEVNSPTGQLRVLPRSSNDFIIETEGWR